MTARRLLAASLVAMLVGVAGACGSNDSSGAPSHLSDAGKRGYEQVQANNCGSCHSLDGTRTLGPTWDGLAGSEVVMSDGTTKVVDTDYLTRAIVDPRSEQREGFTSSMPTYRFLTAEEVADIVTYIQELGEV